MTVIAQSLLVDIDNALAEVLKAGRLLRRARVLDPIIKDHAAWWRKMFLKQEKVMLDRLEQKRAYFKESLSEWDSLEMTEQVFQLTWNDMVAGLRVYTGRALLAGVKNLIGELGFDIAFDLKNPRAVAFMEAHGAELVTHVNEYTRSQIRTILTTGIDEGWSYSKTAEAIASRFQEFRVGVPYKNIRSRAELVSTTESHFAYGQGNRMAAEQIKEMGVELEKRWITSGGERVCEACDSNERVDWIDMDQPFPSGDQTVPAHPACECDCEYQPKGME